MKKRKTLKIIGIVALAGIIIAGSIGYYLYNMPHRDVINSKSDYNVKASVLVEEYLANAENANKKYLDEEGESKIFEVEGKIDDISTDFNEQIVLLLKSEGDKAGVSCTFTKKTNNQAEKLKIGQIVKIKGVIRSGATFDADLDMYENVIIEKCSIEKK